MGATLPEETPPADGPVEQYARLAEVFAKRPKLAEVLPELLAKLALAEDGRITGTVSVNFQTGVPKGVTIKGG